MLEKATATAFEPQRAQSFFVGVPGNRRCPNGVAPTELLAANVGAALAANVGAALAANER